MLSRVIVSILLILTVKYVKSARILAVFPTPSISHQIVFRPLTHELVRRGHEVTIITTDPAFSPDQAPINLTEINVHDLSYTLWAEEFLKEAIGNKDDMSTQLIAAQRTMLKIITSQLETTEIKEIIERKRGDFDVLLLEAYVQPALIYSHFFKIPVILISSFSGMTYNYRAVGISTFPLWYPTVLHQRLYSLSNWEKLELLYDHWCLETILMHIEEEHNAKLKSIYGSSIPSLYELSNNVDMLLLNANPQWVDNLPVPTNVIYIGGIHVPPRKELPEDLQYFLDSSKNGVIYFSFGTNVMPSALPPKVIQIFVMVLSQLPYDVLWKWDKMELPEETKNIKIFQWLPQSDLLRHPKVKLFITQGGLQSTDEAISAAVPLVGIPMLGDQWFNVQKYVYHQIGLQLDLPSLTEEKFRRAIETVIGDKRYRENIVRLRTIMMDQPQTPLDRAVWWTEHVIRHGGARHLRAAGANITWSQYLELELVLIVLSALLFGLIISVVSVNWLWQFMRQKLKSNIKRKVL